MPAGLVPPACVPGELVACVQVASQLARWVAYGAVGAAPTVCYAEEPANASGGAAPLQAYAACADGTKYTNIGGESAESYPPVKAPREVVTAFCAAHDLHESLIDALEESIVARVAAAAAAAAYAAEQAIEEEFGLADGGLDIQ